MAENIRVEIYGEADALRELERRGIIEIEWVDPERNELSRQAKVEKSCIELGGQGYVVEEEYRDHIAYMNPQTMERARVYRDGEIYGNGRYMSKKE